MSDSDSDDDDMPLSSRLAAQPTAAAPMPLPAPSPAPAPAPVPAPAPIPAPAPPAAAKRKRAAAPAAAKAAPKGRSGVSGRAARTGAGGFDLSEAAGDLDTDYETLGVLGRGNFSEVNLVRHRTTHTLCALKFCCKLDAPSLTHLRAEAKLASSVHSPFVLSPLAVADSAGRAGNFSVLLPLCPGGDLLQLMRRQAGRRFGEAATRHYGAMIALGLNALHVAKLAYRDLKPENLLLKANGYLCLADLGFTAPFSECRRAKVGTPMYQAPELLNKQPHGAPVDWWAFGCLMLECVNGYSPFGGHDDDDATEAAISAHEAGTLPSPPMGEAAKTAAAGDATGSTDKEAPAASDEAGTSAPVPSGAPTAPSTALRAICVGLLHPSSDARLGSVTAGGFDALKGHEWWAGFDWAACEAMTTPAPNVPPPLDPMDADATLLELSRRCQQGFD